MKIRWVDRIVFLAINHLLSRKRNQRFDVRELEQFIEEWDGRAVAEFYDVHRGLTVDDATMRVLAESPCPVRRQVRFPSPAPCPVETNNHIWVEFHLAHPIDRAPIFFVQHGWRSVSVRGYHRMCRQLNTLGINAGILHLPYHFSRRPRGSFNGELAISCNVVRSALALRQAVRELCWLRNLLQRLGAPAVGLWGTSYGAWISAMAVTLDAGFDGALLLEPPVEIEELFWEAPLFSKLQTELNRLNISRERLSGLFRLVTPRQHPLQIDPSRVLILGSEHDPIGYPASLRRLHAAWPGSYLEIFPYGHISYRLHTSAVARFLALLSPKLLTRLGGPAPGKGCA